MGGDSTLRMSNVYKSLKALAGDNDRIFVILDDRADPWQTQVTTRDEANGEFKTRIETPKNLIQISPYFYHLSKEAERLQGIRRSLAQLSFCTDLDIGMLTIRDFLMKVHSQFFEVVGGLEKDVIYDSD